MTDGLTEYFEYKEGDLVRLKSDRTSLGVIVEMIDDTWCWVLWCGDKKRKEVTYGIMLVQRK